MTAAEWLSALTAITGGSSREAPVQEFLRERLAPCVARGERDGAGNLLLWRDEAGNRPVLLLCAHCDQVAMYVERALPGGFLRLRAPGIDRRCLPGQPVTVAGRPGVIGMVPPHMRRKGEELPTGEEDLWVDLGPLAVDDLPPIGTEVYFRTPGRPLGLDRFTGPGLDDRASVAAIALALEELRGERLPVQVVAAFTAGEESGRLGAAFLGERIAADLALVLDVTFADQPECLDDRLACLGGGPALGVGPNVTSFVLRHLEAVCQDAGIESQREPLPGDSGTDGWALQLGGLGIATGLVSIPLTSMHSPAEVVSVEDVRRTAALLAACARRGVPQPADGE